MNLYSSQRVRLLVCLLVLTATIADTPAPPPLVTGDVPTANKGMFELYSGFRYQDTGTITRQVPFTELVYGVTERQEVMVEAPFLSRKGEHGIGDVVVGTKYVFVRESERLPGIAGSFELKLPTGDEDRGLGSGEFDYDIRLRTQKGWDWFTVILNIGYTFIGEPELGGDPQDRRNVFFTSFAQEYQVHEKTKLLSEIYWLNSEEPEEPHRLAANVGFKHKIRPDFTIHASAGKSLREGNKGGPSLRIYVGVKYEFGFRSTK
jgi:hypothetical protein